MNGSPALLVIDMQSCAFDGKHSPVIDQGQSLLTKVATLLDAARAAALPVIFSQHCAPEGPNFKEGTEGWRIHASIAPRASETIVRKSQSSAFDDTRLAEVLASKGIDTLIICGTQSEYCVNATTTSALGSGLTAYVAMDAHGTVPTDDADARSIIERQNRLLSELGAEVQSTRDLTARLLAL